MTILQAQQLGLTRHYRALFDGIDVCLAAGDCLHIRGANGSGKSSLLRILAGLLEPESGAVVTRPQPEKQLYLGHQLALKADLDALGNLRWLAALFGLPFDVEATRATLQHLGLRGVLHQPLRTLSAGQQRRVMLARLWLGDATLWLLDEPLTALDQASSMLVEERILAHQSAGGAVVITSHQSLQVVRPTAELDLGRATASPEATP